MRPGELPRQVPAAVVDVAAAAPRIAVVPMPDRRPGHTLLEVLAAPLNPLDLLIAAGQVPAARPQPGHVPGLECVGTVLASEQFAAGTVVYAESAPPGRGSCSTHVVVRDANMIELPAGLDPVLAAAIGNAGVAAFTSLVETAGIRPGATVLVLGATGVVGRLAVQIAIRHGAGRVVGVGRDVAALERVLELGADAVVELRSDDDETTLRDRLSAVIDAADVVLDGLYGTPLQAALHVCAPRAHVVNIGDVVGPAIQLPAALLRGRQLTVTGVAGLLTPLRDKRRALTWLWSELASGTLQVDAREFALADLPIAWALQAASPHAKCVIVPGGRGRAPGPQHRRGAGRRWDA